MSGRPPTAEGPARRADPAGDLTRVKPGGEPRDILMGVKNRCLSIVGFNARPGAGALLRVLAALAIALLLYKPICDVQTAFAQGAHDAPHAVQHGEHDGHALPCCSTLEEGGVVKLAEPALAAWSGGAGMPLAAAFLFFVAVRVHRSAALSPGRPPGPRSYYARSARILR